jgi:hypothetical protein
VTVAHRVELSTGHDAEDVVELQDEPAVRREDRRDRGDDRIGVRDVRKQIVVDHQGRAIGAVGVSARASRQLARLRHHGEPPRPQVVDEDQGAFDDRGRDARCGEEVVKVASVAGHLDDAPGDRTRQGQQFVDEPPGVVAHRG